MAQWEDAFLGKEHIRLKARALVTRLHNIDDAVQRDSAPVRQIAMNENNVVQLNDVLWRHGDPEIKRLRVFGSQYLSDLDTHCLVSANSLASMALLIDSGSPSRCRSSCSRAPTGSRFCGTRGSRQDSATKAGMQAADKLASSTARFNPTPLLTSSLSTPAMS